MKNSALRLLLHGLLLCLLSLLLAAMVSGCAGPTGSPFTSASAPQAGKIPVKVVAGAHVNGSLADPTAPTYTAGADIVFGRVEPWYSGLLRLFTFGPLTPEDAARWDADLRAQAAATLPRVGVVHYPGEAP